MTTTALLFSCYLLFTLIATKIKAPIEFYKNKSTKRVRWGGEHNPKQNRREITNIKESNTKVIPNHNRGSSEAPTLNHNGRRVALAQLGSPARGAVRPAWHPPIPHSARKALSCVASVESECVISVPFGKEGMKPQPIEVFLTMRTSRRHDSHVFGDRVWSNFMFLLGSL